MTASRPAARGGTGVIIAGALLLFVLKPRIRLMFARIFSKKLKKDITDERSYHGNFQVGSGENIFDCPS
jgi:hypothetical protein